MDKQTGKSQRRGFVEFAEHDDAKAALHQLNANPYVFDSDNRPVVEFAVEDIKKVRLHKLRSQERQQRSMQARDGIQKGYLAEVLKKTPQNSEEPADREGGARSGGGDEGSKMPNNQRKKMFLKMKWKKIRERTQKSGLKRSTAAESKPGTELRTQTLGQMPPNDGIVKVNPTLMCPLGKSVRYLHH